MLALFQTASHLIGIHLDPLDDVVSRARKEFSENLARARYLVKGKYKSSIPREREDREIIRDALDATYHQHQSKHMAVSHALSGAGAKTAPDLFTDRFSQDHFIEGSHAYASLLNDTERLISQFSFGIEASKTAARLLYGRFYEAVSSHSQAANLLKRYLKALKKELGTNPAILKDNDIKDALKIAFAGNYPDAEQALIGSVYFLRSESKEVVDTPPAGYAQHIGWLEKVQKIVRSGNQGLSGRIIGEIAGALQSSPATPPKLRPTINGSTELRA